MKRFAATCAAALTIAFALTMIAPTHEASATASYAPRNGDPCTLNMRVSVPISQTASAQLFAGSTAKQTYICHLDLVTATAQNVALVEGTGAVCATGTAGMAGGTTAATGWNLAANTGVTLGIGSAWVLDTATAADNVCLLQSSTGQVSGAISYVQQ